MSKSKVELWIATAACLALAGCGEGGAGVQSASSNIPTPTPANTLITNLQANQNFAVDGASATTAIDLGSKTVTGAATAPSSIQVSYDATARSYTVTTTARSQTFQPANIQTGTAVGETRYVTTFWHEQRLPNACDDTL